MADKKAVLVKFAGAVPGSGTKFSKKCLSLPAFTNGEYEGAHAALKCSVQELAAELETDQAFFCIEAGSESDIDAVVDAADRQTTIAVAAENGLFFYGHGIIKGAEINRTAQAKDIVPTLAYIAGLPVWPEATGAVLYQVLKDPDMHINEIEKLKTALKRMEDAMARESKEPWDKHDCA